MVSRVYVEKRKEYANDAESLRKEICENLGISNVTGLRIIHRYDVEGITPELFEQAVKTVFSEPPVDTVSETLDTGADERVFAVEYLPGQFDQRANSASECIQLISKGKRPEVRTASVYVIKGDISDDELSDIKKYVINPVDAREASLEEYDTLEQKFDIPTSVPVIEGFRDFSKRDLIDFIEDNGLAMDLADLKFCQDYFRDEKRDPTITEIKVIDTYWSDHCRHTTFNTVLDSVKFEDQEIQDAYDEYMNVRKELGRTKPVTLMDIGTIAAKYLKKQGKLDKLDESEEINACTVKIKVDVDGESQDWLLLFKNETHNHPTEIEPFGGAATCIGGAIRDPLSGRSYVYGAMRVTGAGDPLTPVSETLEGKLPQRKIVTTAADGYSSYGNQIGLATGQVDEVYHPGYVAKRMEVGAVIAAAPAENVKRETPAPGDVVILLGGRTGRDGIGGATGASKAHDSESLETCGAEVQKGNAPEERKLQRLFRNAEASKMIKRCNDFGAGGVSVAIGELADGLDIDLNKVTKKYEGLDGTELAISESQERMAVVVTADDADRFCEIAHDENLEATKVAVVTEEPRLIERWNGRTIVDISREFLDTDGVEKHIDAEVVPEDIAVKDIKGDFREDYMAMASDLNCCSKRGLSEEFDSTIGAGTVLMPFGGKYQRTPTQAMVNLISVEKGRTDDCSLMAWGFDPYVSSASPFRGAYLAVVESVAKLIATGASFDDIYLSFQEYFGSPKKDPERWGKPLAAVLGAFKAQMGLGVAAIGGKDSMSGTFNDLDVPPTLISFAVTTAKTKDIISPEFKKAGDKLVLITPTLDENGLPEAGSLKRLFRTINMIIRGSLAESVYAVSFGGTAEAVMKMAMGNGFGFRFNDGIDEKDLFRYNYGAFLVEIPSGRKIEGDKAVEIGTVTDDGYFTYRDTSISNEELFGAYEEKLEPVYRCNIETAPNKAEAFSYDIAEKGEKRTAYTGPDLGGKRPKALIPVFPGTNCEYDTAKAFEDAGAEPDVFVVNNLTAEDVSESVRDFAAKVRESQIIFIPGGFSAGDEPDGSGKFITSFFRNPEIKDAVTELLDERKGLMAGICNGFQALIKLGLVPYGRITDQDVDSPTLTFNEIRRHQSMLVRTRVASNKSPWMAYTKPGEIYTVPVSHGEGRFIAPEDEIRKLAENGQILTQYADTAGQVSADIADNPNGSFFSIEGITSPDGRVLGKMGHTERTGEQLYKNVPGIYDMRMFEAAVDYFRSRD
jgi:phosphoribosylformylglycinamidine synthase